MTDEGTLAAHVAKDATFTTKALVTSAASAIPVIGAPISTPITLWEGEKISRRIEKLVNEASRLAEAVEGKLDGSGSFGDRDDHSRAHLIGQPSASDPNGQR